MDEKYASDDEFDVDEIDDDEEVPVKIKKTKSIIKPPKDDDDEEENDEEENENDDEEDDEEDDDDNESGDEDAKIEDIIGKMTGDDDGLKTKFPAIDDSDEDDDDDADENYLQKFEENIQKNIIAEYHPELHAQNYDEIDVLSRVVRDENGVIIDPLHKTLPFITRYEKARIIGERAKQLNAGAKPLVEVDVSIIDGYVIALKEYEEKKIPFIIKRPLPNGGCEFWKFKDLEILA
jgi:DNA-directed RNA polymerase I, II, and III subunit RPABC2